MSELTEALEQLDYWLYDNEPEIFDSLPSGLSSEEIDEQSYSLMFKLPTEVRELYQWRNGCRALFYSIYCGTEGLTYSPLDIAVRQTYNTGDYINNFGGLQLNNEKEYKNILLKNCVEQDAIYQNYKIDLPLQEWRR